MKALKNEISHEKIRITNFALFSKEYQYCLGGRKKEAYSSLAFLSAYYVSINTQDIIKFG